MQPAPGHDGLKAKCEYPILHDNVACNDLCSQCENPLKLNLLWKGKVVYLHFRDVNETEVTRFTFRYGFESYSYNLHR